MQGNNDSASSRNEGLDKGKLNTLNTVALLSVLIATVTYTAGINPPDAFKQEGQQIVGKAIASEQTTFKIFSIFNNIALFASLFVVLFISSISPVHNKALNFLLAVNAAITWMAAICMAAAYLAVARVLLPHGQWKLWVTFLAISVAILIVFVILVVYKCSRGEARAKRPGALLGGGFWDFILSFEATFRPRS